MPITIKSKREGFRRCGIPHSVEEITYPDDRFTEDELKRLMEEPMLTVERTPIESIKDDLQAGTEPVKKQGAKSKKGGHKS